MRNLGAKIYLALQGLQKIVPSRGWARFSFFVIVLFSIFIATHYAFAEDITSYVYNALIDVVSGVLLWGATLCIKVSIFALKFVIELGSYNGYITSEAVNVGWIIMRDMANMFFVVALLVIAFGTILGLDNYSWNKTLGKFFLAAILVNFSRTICGLVIDVSQVIMMTFISGVAATAGGNLINAFGLTEIMKLSSSPVDPAEIARDGNVFMAAVAGLVFTVLVLGVMVVYVGILLARMIGLWILIVLSPLAFAFLALPKTQDKFKEWWTQFSDNVIVGPILAFFLWLAFVTVGGGNSHKHVSENSDIPLDTTALKADTDKVGGTGVAGTASAGITKAMTWDSMANFFIALGMLYVGIKKAQETKVAGTGALSGALDMAKKVGMAASGLSLAKYGAEQGKKGMKAGFNKFIANPIKRNAGVLASKANILKSKADKARNAGAKSLEEKSKRYNDLKKQFKSGAITKDEFKKKVKDEKLGFIRRKGRDALASVIESGGRKDKKAQDWKDTAEAEAKITENNYATSSTPGGQAKIEAKGRERRSSASSSGKGTEKEAKEDLRIKLRVKTMNAENEAKKLKAEADSLAGSSDPADVARVKALEEKIDREEGISEKAREDHRKIFDGKDMGNKWTSHDIENAKMMESEYGTGAFSGQVNTEIEEQVALEKAKKQDELLKAQGRHSEANNVQNVSAEQAKKRTERLANNDSVASKNNTTAQLKRIRDIMLKEMREGGITTDKDVLAKMNQTELESHANSNGVDFSNNQELIQAQRSLSEMQQGNLSLGSAMNDINADIIHGEVGQSRKASMDITPDAIRQQQAKKMSELTGMQVGTDPTDLKAAMKIFRRRHGEKADGMLREIRLNSEKSAEQGGLNQAGLFNLDEDGNTILTDTEQAGWEAHVEGRRENAIDSAIITAIKGFDGTLDVTEYKDPITKKMKTHRHAESEGSQDLVAQMFANLTNNNLKSVTKYSHDSIREMLTHTSRRGLEKLFVKMGAANPSPEVIKGLFETMGVKQNIYGADINQLMEDYLKKHPEPLSS